MFTIQVVNLRSRKKESCCPKWDVTVQQIDYYHTQVAWITKAKDRIQRWKARMEARDRSQGWKLSLTGTKMVTSFVSSHVVRQFDVVGPAPALFKSKHTCLRIYYQQDGETGYFHTLRTTNTRLFNNIVIIIKNEEEARGKSRLTSQADVLTS